MKHRVSSCDDCPLQYDGACAHPAVFYDRYGVPTDLSPLRWKHPCYEEDDEFIYYDPCSQPGNSPRAPHGRDKPPPKDCPLRRPGCDLHISLHPKCQTTPADEQPPKSD